MCVIIGAFLAVVHMIPMALYFLSYTANWFVQPTLAQNTPLEKPQINTSSNIILQTIRGGRHKDYASVVFQFSEGISFDEPTVKGDELHFVLPNVSTGLPPFRRFKTFDSWARLEIVEEGLAVRIGLPKDFNETRAFTMKDPARLVVNIYDDGNQLSMETRMSPPRLRVAIPAQHRPTIGAHQAPSITISEMQFVDSTVEQEGLLEGIREDEVAGESPGGQAPGKTGPGGGGGMSGHAGGSGMGSAGGGVSSPSKRYRVRITPKISVKGEYDDNIFLYKDNQKGDFITTVSPGLLLYMDSGRNGLELEYTFGWVRYHDLSENDFVRHNGRLKFWQRLSRHLTFNLSDSYLKSNDLFDQDLPPDLRPQRIRHTAAPYQRNDFNTSLDYQFGPQSRLSVGYRHGYLDNDDPYLEDVVEHSPYANLSYWVNNKDGFELGYKYRRFDYTLGESYGNNRVDLDAHDVDVAYMHRFGRQATVRVRYGFANRNFKGIPVAYHIHDGGVGFEYGFSKSMSLALEIGYFSPTGIDINPGLEYTGRFEKRFRRGRVFVSARSGWDEGFMDVEPRAFTRYWGGDAGVEYEPVHDLQAYAGVDYRKNDYALQEQEDDETVGGRCGIRYRFLRWFSADLGYAHRRRVSKDPNNEYGDNRFTLTVTAAKPHPYNWEF
ncbi:MAG: outer membrane beta-barrel protein [Candidatus Desulfacyla sp.]